MKANFTDITVILDRSGSMESIRRDMEGGFNNFIEKQKSVPGDCVVSLCQFDTQFDIVYTAKPLSEVPKLDLVPRGGTALLDAMARAIDSTGTRLANMREEDRPSQVVILIISDGEENSSYLFDRTQVFDRITHQTDKYSWNFVFLGTNQDSIATAASFGISASNTLSYTNTSTGVYTMFDNLAYGMKSNRISGVSRLINVVDQNSYNDAMSVEDDNSPTIAGTGSTIVANGVITTKTTNINNAASA